MNKQRSWMRQEYKTAFAWLRRGIDTEYLLSTGNLAREAILAADYSYQAKDYHVKGWINDRRLDKFIEKLEYKHHSYWWIPF